MTPAKVKNQFIVTVSANVRKMTIKRPVNRRRNHGQPLLFPDFPLFYSFRLLWHNI